MSLITHRPYILEQDTTSIEELILASRTGKTLERYPTIWRVCQLLASRVWEPERDAHVWEDASGRCIGFAYLWRRIWLVRLIITCQNQTFLQVMLYNCSLEKKILLHIKHSLALHLLVWNIACSSLKVQNINIWSLLLLTIHSSLILNALSGKKNGNRQMLLWLDRLYRHERRAPAPGYWSRSSHFRSGSLTILGSQHCYAHHRKL